MTKYAQPGRIGSHGKQVPDIFYDESSSGGRNHPSYSFDHPSRILRMAPHSEKMDPPNFCKSYLQEESICE